MKFTKSLHLYYSIKVVKIDYKQSKTTIEIKLSLQHLFEQVHNFSSRMFAGRAFHNRGAVA